MQAIIALSRCSTLAATLLVAVAYCNRAEAVIVFADDFNRPNSTTIGSTAGPGSGTWNESQQGFANGDVLIADNQMLVDHNIGGTVYSVNTTTAGFLEPWNNVLNANPGKVTWTLNMQSSRPNLTGFVNTGTGAPQDGIGMALIANGAAVGATQGYGLFWGGTGTGGLDPLTLLSFNGFGSTQFITASMAPFDNVGTNYLSIRVEYEPSTETWTLFARDDGPTAFADPSVDTGYVNLGSAFNNEHTSLSMSHLGMFGSYSSSATDVYRYDNLAIDVDTGLAPGDYNGDGEVDAADYVRWRDGLSTPFTPLDPQDYQTWKQNFGASSGTAAATAVSEPSTLLLFFAAFVGSRVARRS